MHDKARWMYRRRTSIFPSNKEPELLRKREKFKIQNKIPFSSLDLMALTSHSEVVEAFAKFIADNKKY